MRRKQGRGADRAHAPQVEDRTAHAEQHSVRSGEAHGGLNIAFCQAARDQRRAAIDGAVADLACFVACVISGAERAATGRAAKASTSVHVGPTLQSPKSRRIKRPPCRHFGAELSGPG